MKKPKNMMAGMVAKQKMPSTPPSKAEAKTSRPARVPKVEMPNKPQPVPQNTKRKKGVV